jgi:predicted amidohydrolase YtcJ
MRAPLGFAVACLLVACGGPGSKDTKAAPKADSPKAAAPGDGADLILTNARVYTLAWGEPALDGTPAKDAPRDTGGWHPDATAIAIANGKILAVGGNEEIDKHRGKKTRIVDLEGATALPGFIDSHVHIHTHGLTLTKVNLVGVDTEDEAIGRIEARAKETPKGDWIQAWGFDEGMWADRYPDNRKLSERVPDHPVHVEGLHGFASWSNALALEKAKIGPSTKSPVGGEIVLAKDGQPTGILLNNASDLFDDVIPPPTPEKRAEAIVAGMNDLASKGYVGLHEAGAGGEAMRAFQTLEDDGRLPIRAYAMLRVEDDDLINEWIGRGPEQDLESMLTVRCVKAFYDASLGVRGARLLEDYSDKPGHRGVSGSDYGFDQGLVAKAMAAGFQVGIHAIGDAGNRESLDFIESVLKKHPDVRKNRHRIEHAQVVHPDDQPRFAKLDVIASMEPPHQAEDMAWAEDRLGKERAAHAYAWRSLRKQGARLAFNSDLPGSDPSLFYGLHSAVTRRNKEKKPDGGWFPEEVMTAEEAVRGYTIWNAYMGFTEDLTGTIAPGKWADITVIDIDPFVLADTDPGKLLDGKPVMTIVAGRIVYGG